MLAGLCGYQQQPNPNTVDVYSGSESAGISSVVERETAQTVV